MKFSNETLSFLFNFDALGIIYKNLDSKPHKSSGDTKLTKTNLHDVIYRSNAICIAVSLNVYGLYTTHLFAYASLVKGENILFLDCKIHKRSFFLNSIFSLFEAIFIFFACHELINTIPFVISCFQLKLYRFYSDIDVFGIDSPNKFCWNTNGEGCKAFGNSYQNVRAFWDTYILHTKINGQ